MTRRSTTLLASGATLLTFALIAAAALAWLLLRSLPAEDGTRRAAGLAAPVDIYRDAMGVPHILAAGEADLAFATGYVHAQDRLWQMDFVRRYGQGRLAEVLGPRALPSDRLMRTLGIARIADSLLARVSLQTRGLLAAYSAGVNACMRDTRGRRPVEFDMLQYQPEPWTPAHSLLVARLMGWELSLSWWTDLVSEEIVARVGEERAREVLPRDEDDAPRLAPPPSPATAEAAAALRTILREARGAFRSTGSAVGSNAWAVSAARGGQGRPMLAGDPHLLLMQPARFYLVHLSAPGCNVAGASIPGAPGVIIGRTTGTAWSMTALMADDTDFFLEQVDERDSTYLHRGARRRLRVRTDSILVRDSLPVPLQVIETLHGPVVSAAHPSRYLFPRGRFTPPRAVSVRWAGRDVSDEILAVHRMNRARTWTEFLDAARSFGVPAQRAVFADAGGTIGVTAMGRVPLRAGGAPDRLNDGAAGTGAWTGYLPFDALPRSVNPPGGTVWAANDRPEGPHAAHISSLWESASRSRRIGEMLGEQERFSVEDFRLMQADTRSPWAGPVRDAFVAALRAHRTRSLALTRAMNLLAGWDLTMKVSSVEAALFNAAWRHLVEATFEDEMGRPLFTDYVFLSNVPTRALPRMLADTVCTWFDDVRTAGRETRDGQLVLAIARAVDELRAAMGPDQRRWTWGRLHTVELKHPLGAVAPLDRVLDVGPYPVPGTNTTVCSGEYALADPYRMVVGPALRIVADLASRDTCWAVLPGGQSGQPVSPHYADMLMLWLHATLHPIAMDPAVVRSAAWKHLVLTP